ncbi:glutathione S-transferase [Gammaproteobacteria bacterium]|nr:glutathione S-transferase [Gammaproteobacteria bacterium]
MVQRLENSAAKIELGYWAIRGLGQPIRFLLAFAEVPFSEVRLGAYPDGTLITDRSVESADWEEHKKTIEFPFPNLPYLIDSSGPNEVRLTQSNAVMRYLGRRFDLYGDCESDRAAIDVLQDEAYDFRNWIIKTAYVETTEYSESLAEFIATAIPRYVDRFEQYLLSTGAPSHFVGERISLVDFILYELIWQTSVMVPGSITDNNRPSLFAFIESFANIPQIAAYMLQSSYIERPINSLWTAFK